MKGGVPETRKRMLGDEFPKIPGFIETSGRDEGRPRHRRGEADGRVFTLSGVPAPPKGRASRSPRRRPRDPVVSPGPPAPPMTDDYLKSAQGPAFDQARRLGRGINLGNALDA